jgi:hypothetical protein
LLTLLPRSQKSLSASPTFTAEDFQEEYTDKFLRLILYLTIFASGARDWITQDIRIGFDREDNELNEGFKPEWHHIFPRKILKDKYDESLIDSIANIAVLNEKANRSFSAKPPSKYLEEHGVKPERLQEQAVPPQESLVLEKYEDFLRQRAQQIAERATKFMQELAGWAAE